MVDKEKYPILQKHRKNCVLKQNQFLKEWYMLFQWVGKNITRDILTHIPTSDLMFLLALSSKYLLKFV